MKTKIIFFIILLQIISHSITYASVNDTAQVKEMIIALEKSIKTHFMSNNWNKRRSVWLNALQQSGSDFAVVKKAILQLDQNIRMDAYKSEYQNSVADWHLYLTSADSVKLIYQALLEINQSLDPFSREESWRSQEANWLAKIKAGLN